MKRRQFITLLGGAAAWPLAARAQQPNRMRRIGVLMNLTADDQEAQSRLAGFLQGLQELGWAVGRNVRIDYRWGGDIVANYDRDAEELIALAPDALLASSSTSLGALERLTRTLPIIFVNVIDPVGAGFVSGLARPGANPTGFTLFEFGVSAKWLELLKQVAPRVTRVAVIRDFASPPSGGQLGALQAVAPSLRVELTSIDGRNEAEIERAVAAFAIEPNGGLVVTASNLGVHRKVIIALAAHHQLPAIYPFHYYASDGGLISYGPDYIDQYRRAAGYVDRILKGEKPADLPVQAPTKYELVINLKTAKALGLTIPPGVLATADEVIE